MQIKEIFVDCDCGLLEHMFAFRQWDDDGWPTLSLNVHLSTWENPFRRLWTAIKWVFGYRCQYGEWDEIVVSPEKAKEIIKFLKEFVVYSGKR